MVPNYKRVIAIETGIRGQKKNKYFIEFNHITPVNTLLLHNILYYKGQARIHFQSSDFNCLGTIGTRDKHSTNVQTIGTRDKHSTNVQTITLL